jgi:hypothetical protein
LPGNAALHPRADTPILLIALYLAFVAEGNDLLAYAGEREHAWALGLCRGLAAGCGGRRAAGGRPTGDWTRHRTALRYLYDLPAFTQPVPPLIAGSPPRPAVSWSRSPRTHPASIGPGTAIADAASRRFEITLPVGWRRLAESILFGQ